MVADKPVIPALRLAMPKILLLFSIAASCAFSCDWPEMYAYAPPPMNTALPANMYVSGCRDIAREGGDGR